MIVATLASEASPVLVGLGLLLTVGVILGTFFANIKNANKKQTNDNEEKALSSAQSLIAVQREQLSQQKEQLADLQNKHIQNQKEIGSLQGEIKSMREIPLAKISKSLDNIIKLQLLIAQHLEIDGISEIKIEEV